ncbi:MAG: OmpA family protein [Flavobacteriaceae bacterium]|nr:OmpA family protein [Flavobacteriaceae bacterium]
MKNYITLILFFISCIIFSQTTPGEYTVKGVSINTKDSEFGTTFFGKDKVVFAAPKDNAVITRTVWNENKQAFLDLYIGTITEDGEIAGKQRVLGDVNNKFHEGIVAFTKDLKTVYFDANNYTSKNKAKKDSTGTVNIQLYKANVGANGAWTNVVKLPFNNDEYSTGHPTLSIDDKKLYFISDRPGSIGKTDIYVVNINVDGTYSRPKNLGNRINTEEREMFPFISDNNILYFSSNGHPGYGELDVYASKIFDNSVSEPINLEDPVNSKKDDFAYIIDDSNHKGYFSSNRKGGKGDDDIYGFVASPPLYIECNQIISGIVRDKDTEELLPGSTVELLDEQGNQLQSVTSNESDATFSFELPCDTKYTIVGSQQGYLREELPVNTVNDIDADPLEIYLDLPPELIVVDEKIMININTIYFDFDKWDIRPDAAKELDKVISVMKEHPTIVIEAGSHTDSRAREAYNQVLSEKRAKSTVDYIVAAGIDRNRLTAKGYGEMQLVNNCSSFVTCSREEHQLNRRTEFVIVNDDDRFVQVSAPENDIVADVSRPIETEIEDQKDMEVVEPIVEEAELIVESSEIKDSNFDGEVKNTENQETLKPSSRFIKIAPIYYDFDTWSLSDKELIELDKVVQLMKEHPAIIVEAGVHTDAKNRVAYNQMFSDKRAKNVLKYMISKGVHPNRLTAKGYGESRLVNHCKSFVECSDKEQQANRRIEFMIVYGNYYPDEEIFEKQGDTKFISTNPIYFDNDKFDIRKDAAYELNRVIKILQEHPTMVIEAGSHTDSNNTEAYNQVLSENRAKAVKEYMITRGIKEKRIISKGYGEMQLTNKCSSFVKCTPEEHQANRRTEFKIVKI